MIGSHPTREPLPPLYRWHTVVVVDDDPQTLSSLRRELQREPYDTVMADHPRLALQWIDRRDVSVVISDQRMPEMAGDLFLQEVSKKSPTTACVLLTGYPDSAPPGGLLTVVSKPWEESSLKRMIRRLLRQRERILQDAAGGRGAP
jgi:DNA-binding NtrC family response regulator